MNYEVYDESFTTIFSRDPDYVCIASGFRFLEGPVWEAAAERLLFSDIMGNALYTWREDEGVRLFRGNSYLANGNTLDNEGNLITCEHGTSRVSRTRGVAGFSREGEYEVLCDRYKGKELNSPNDVVVAADGAVWFTDPISGRMGRVGIPREEELGFYGLYRYSPDSGRLECMADDFEFPNGLCFSPDGTRLFVNDSRRQHVRVFTLRGDGGIDGGPVFAELTVDGPGVADGMKFDAAGNLFVSGPRGIQVFNYKGRMTGRIFTPEVAANFCWGGPDLTDLFLTATTGLYRVQVGVPGR